MKGLLATLVQPVHRIDLSLTWLGFPNARSSSPCSYELVEKVGSGELSGKMGTYVCGGNVSQTNKGFWHNLRHGSCVVHSTTTYLPKSVIARKQGSTCR
jgi:hypothetical protein